MSWYSISTHLILPVALALVHYLETGDGTTGLLGLGFYWLLAGGVPSSRLDSLRQTRPRKMIFPCPGERGF